jgi:hypothetical protein
VSLGQLDSASDGLPKPLTVRDGIASWIERAMRAFALLLCGGVMLALEVVREGSHIFEKILHGDPAAMTPLVMFILAGVVNADSIMQERQAHALRDDLEKRHREQDRIWIDRFKVMRLEHESAFDAAVARMLNNIRSDMADIGADNEKAVAQSCNTVLRKVELTSERIQAILTEERTKLRASLERNTVEMHEAMERINVQLRHDQARLLEEFSHQLRTVLADLSDKYINAIQPLSAQIDRHAREQEAVLERMRGAMRNSADSAKDAISGERHRLDKVERRVAETAGELEAIRKSALRIESRLQVPAIRRADKPETAEASPAARPWLGAAD